MEHDAIAVIDFGGQYAHLISTKVRKNHVLAEIRQPEDSTELFSKYKGIIISGSPALASHGEESSYNKEIYDLDIPILGLCFGHQEIAQHYGGKVIHGGREWAHRNMRIVREHPLFKGLGPVEQVWMSHFDSVSELGPDFEELGFTELGDTGSKHHFAAIGSDKYRRYGFQFHPEVDDTRHGDQMIANFVLEVCGCAPTWVMEDYVEEQVKRIKRQVGERSVFLLASGGVDSTVAAMLFGMALGADRLRLLHIDNGLMRKNESQSVVEMFGLLGLTRSLHFVDASEDFLRALGDEVDPEKKRAIIGNTFIDVFEKEARKLGIEDHLLGQGTIYPDTIETGGTKRADVIKTHHNRVPLINQMIADGRVVEPLVELYKVEVRELGERLGIPRDLIWRHPFPGPGLGVRLLCSAGPEPFEDYERISGEVSALGKAAGLEAVVLPIKSVGVKADVRSYEHPVLISGSAPWDEIQNLSGTILKEVQGVNRCLWNLSSITPTTFTPLAAGVSMARLDLLREVDHLVMSGLKRYRIYDEIWQCPTVLVPLRTDDVGEELCIIRPVHSERAMTASAAQLPAALLEELKSTISVLPKISGLSLDLTSKPPGTIEWE